MLEKSLVKIKNKKAEEMKMKTMKRLVVLAMAAMMLFSFAACGNSNSNDTGVKVYTMDGKFKSETVNQWRNLYLVDDTTYILELNVLDSQDASKHTVEFVMRGEYTTNSDGTITLQPGWGNGYAMNGDTMLPCTATPDEWNQMFVAMFSVNGITTFTLNSDGTYVPVEE